MANINKLLNFNIDEEILKIKEIIILFYGEEYRDYITEALNKLIFVVYNNPHKVKSYLEENSLNSDEYQQKSEDINSSNLKKMLEAYGIEEKHIKLIENNQIGFNKNVIMNNTVGMIPNIVDDKLITTIYFPTLVINQENLDCTLIHELLHVVEEHIVENKNDNIVLQGGFERWTIRGNDEKDNRDFEFLNELVHQKISQDITNLMHDSDIYIFNDPKEANRSRQNYDSNSSPVIEEFYSRFKEPLLKYKLLGKKEEFEDLIGKKELGELAKWCVYFYNTYTTPQERRKLSDSNNFEYYNKLEEGIKIINAMERNYKVNAK